MNDWAEVEPKSIGRAEEPPRRHERCSEAMGPHGGLLENPSSSQTRWAAAVRK